MGVAGSVWKPDRVDGFTTQIREPFTPSFSKAECKNLTVEVEKMLEKGAIEKSSKETGQFVGHLFLRPKKDRAQRPVFNLKPLNAYVRDKHFKMEGIPMVLDLIQSNYCLAKIDLKAVHFAVWWDHELYLFKLCPFGMRPVPQMFPKLLKPVMAVLRRKEVQLVLFLDDMILINHDKVMMDSHVATAVELLERLEKVLGIKQQCQELLHQSQTNMRVLAKVIANAQQQSGPTCQGYVYYMQLKMQKARTLLRRCGRIWEWITCPQWPR